VQVIREIDPAARIAPDATIGRYCVIGPHVTIGPGTALRGRVSVTGHTTIGSHNVIDEGTVLGATPQDLKYAGTPTLLVIGHRNHIGRMVTAHIGTEAGGCVTGIGNDNRLHDGCHIAHDCYVEDHTTIGRGCQLAGHIKVEHGAVLAPLVGVHHFVTIGRYSRVGDRTPVRRDVPPYTDFHSPDSDWSAAPAVRGVHDDGIAAAKLAPDEQRELRRALAELFSDEAALQTKIEQLVNMGAEGEVAKLCGFIQRSLGGVYGRHRERYRGMVPPEAEPYLPPELKTIRRTLP
jgi:UDP-N-acetylglucosamine acyltransferase